ncbi:hypothetical protein CWC17_15645, partial [Pseudoalteromonas sp. S3785]
SFISIRAFFCFEFEFVAVCFVFRQGRAYVVWLFPINTRYRSIKTKHALPYGFFLGTIDSLLLDFYLAH